MNYLDAHNNLGVMYNKADFPQEALKEFEKSLKIDRRYAETYKLIGYTYYSKLNDNAKAAENFRKYLELAPTASDAGSIRGILDKIE